MQGRREGVKGVTVSRGPDLKRGAGNYKKKRKIGQSKEILLFWAPNLKASRAPKFSSPRPAYSAYTKVNLQLGRGPVNNSFTGPGRALDAPVLMVYGESDKNDKNKRLK